MLAKSIFHYNLNWLPNEATAAFAGFIARGAGFGGGGGGGGNNELTPAAVVGRRHCHVRGGGSSP